MSKTLIFLALAAIIMAVLSLYVAYRIFKKSMKLMTALTLLGGAVVFIGIVAYPKRARIKREVKKVLSLKDKVRQRISPTCKCNKFNYTNLPQDNYPKAHRPSAQKLSHDRFVENELVRTKYIRKKYLVKVIPNQYYTIAYLTHSSPHLTPIALKRLNELGTRFHDASLEQGLSSAKLEISSLTRTKYQQIELKKLDSGATPGKSTHSYGVAFDIKSIKNNRHCKKLNSILFDVLISMRKERKVLLRFENDCIHVTVRG